MPEHARTLVGQQLGAYQLEALLTIGGLPEFFRARHVELGRQVAVKLLPSALAGGRQTLSALRDEARRISALKHPNILPIYGIAETQGILYAVTPLPAASLRDQLDHDGLLPAAHAVQLAAQLAWALHALHGIGFVHGDVRPSMLFFDAGGILQLVDFGAARALTRQRSRRSRVAARAWPQASGRSYIAPEVAQTGEISVRGDIYALGAVLYEMLIGALPLQQAVLGEPEQMTAPLPASMRSSDTWPELAAVALRALERDPAKRYPDARAFAIALRRAVIERPEPPKGPSLRDALAGVWHPEADEAPGASEVQEFKKKLATMPPAPNSAFMKSEPTLKEKLAPSPPAPPSLPVTPPAAYHATNPPPPSVVPPPREDLIATTLLPDRPPPNQGRPPSSLLSQLPTQPLPELPELPTQPLPEPPPPYGTPPARAPLASSRPLRLSMGPAPAPPAPYAEMTPGYVGPPPPFAPEDGYVSPAELARILAGRQPGRARRATAALAGVALILAFGAATAGVLTGFGRGVHAGNSAGPPSATVIVTTYSPTMTVKPNVTIHHDAAPPPTATTQATLPPNPTSTPAPAPTPTPSPSPTPTPTPSPTPTPTPTVTPTTTPVPTPTSTVTLTATPTPDPGPTPTATP